MEEEPKRKTIFEDEVICPFCKKRLSLRRVKEVITEPVKGEYKEETIVEKSKQKTLSEENI